MLERYNAEIDEETQALERECLKEENIPGRFNLPNYSLTEHFLGQIEYAEIAPRNARCFLRCWYKKMGILKENLVTSAGPIPELGQHMRECNEIATEWAQNQANGDECEFAWSFYTCMHESLVKCLTQQFKNNQSPQNES